MRDDTRSAFKLSRARRLHLARKGPKVSKHGALRPQKPQGLLGTGRRGGGGMEVEGMEVEEEGDYIPIATLSPSE